MGRETASIGRPIPQPPRIKHTMLGYSDNCEVLEIVLPADFKTVTHA
jgi:hypothetical protein